MYKLDLNKKRVLIREDLNVPLKDGKVSSDARLLAALPTIRDAITQGTSVILCSHLGRPVEGQIDEKFSLAPVAKRLSELLDQEVKLIKKWREPFDCQPGEVVLLENVRFNVGEKDNDPELAKAYAALCDVFIMDAFATAHRAQASTVGVIECAKSVGAGPLLKKEYEALSRALANPEKPLLAIVGGAKVSTKLNVLEALADKVDQLIVGGGIANTFIAASGYNIGQSLHEEDLIPIAQQLLNEMNIPLPEDVVVSDRFEQDAGAIVKKLSDITDNDMILDVGPETSKKYAAICQSAGTIIWNGPVGVFEWPQFAAGTEALANAIAASDAFTLAGGGDTLAALDQFGVRQKLSYVSTGGGAFLEFIEGKKLPAIAALEERTKLQESIVS